MKWIDRYEKLQQRKNELNPESRFHIRDAWTMNMGGLRWYHVHLTRIGSNQSSICRDIFERWLRRKIIALPDEVRIVADRLKDRFKPRNFNICTARVYVHWGGPVNWNWEDYGKENFRPIDLKSHVTAMIKVVSIEARNREKKDKAEAEAKRIEEYYARKQRRYLNGGI